MLKRQRFSFNKHDCIVKELIRNCCVDRYHSINNDERYVLPDQHDIIVEGVYYAGVREYLSLQEIYYEDWKVIKICFEVHRVNSCVFERAYNFILYMKLLENPIE